MKRVYAIIFVLGNFVLYSNAQTIKKDLTILLSGASFASPENGWFEIGCETLQAKGINRAINGEAINLIPIFLKNGVFSSLPPKLNLVA